MKAKPEGGNNLNRAQHLRAGYIAAVAVLMCAATATAQQDDWGGDLQIYGWLPVIDNQAADGSQFKITREDILSDLDVAMMAAGRVNRGRWSLATDLIYFDVSNKSFDVALLLPGLASIEEGGLQSWIITPNIGYTVLDNDTQKVELYAGARYFWIETDLTFDVDPVLPGEPSTKVHESVSESNWDAIVGIRGLYYLSDKWFVPYSVNAGTGESDFTWTAQGGLGYRFSRLDALFGWRYMSYDIGSDTVIKEITINGPFAGVMFRW